MPTLPATAEFTVEVPLPSDSRACSTSDDANGADAALLAAHRLEYDDATSAAVNARVQIRTSSIDVPVCESL